MMLSVVMLSVVGPILKTPDGIINTIVDSTAYFVRAVSYICKMFTKPTTVCKPIILEVSAIF
jgi:hypothetical protein